MQMSNTDEVLYSDKMKPHDPNSFLDGSATSNLEVKEEGGEAI